MSTDYNNLCSAILEQCFGKVVQTVADCLLGATTRTVVQITNATNLSRKEVILALSVLIKFHLIMYSPSSYNPYVPIYSIKRDDVLFLLRYSRYIHIIQNKYGNIGSAIAEELLKSGSDTATNILVKCIKSKTEKDQSVTVYRDTFFQLINDNFFIKMPPLITKNGGLMDTIPKYEVDVHDYYEKPEIDLNIINKILMGVATSSDASDAEIFWRINYNRFHQEFRDKIMIDAIERKLGETAAECFRFILKRMYECTDPLQREFSNPITLLEVKQMIEKQPKNLELLKYLDQYIALINYDSLGFLRKVADTGCGQYVVDMPRAFFQLAVACTEGIITERFGSKAARIFRCIRLKNYIEQEDLQKEVMIPAKEAKSMAYSLFRENFIQVKTIKKSGGGGSGPAKIYHLFHIKEQQTVTMILDICYKALYNAIHRSSFEKNENKSLIEKSQRLDNVVQAMRERGESEEYISEVAETLTPPENEILKRVKSRIKALSKAELTIDDTIFLFQKYVYHCTIAQTLPSNQAPKELK